MNAERLLELYHRIADAPDAIARLRRFVLDIAVRGGLVEQDPADEPASELLKQIESERNERIKRREIRRSKPLVSIDDAPFDPPSGWVWIPLGETGNIFTGNSINAQTREHLEKVPEGRPFIATKDVGYGLDKIDYVNGLLVDFLDERFKIAKANSVFICAEGGSAGKKTGLTDQEICFGNKLLANETWSVISSRFVLYVYLSEFFYEQFSEKMTGVIGGISIRNFLQLPFPLPPLAEQHRIVAKVDQLMALCDRLETSRAEREATRDRLAAASLSRLSAPDPDPEAFQTHAAFALDNLAPLTTRPDQIKALRQTILNLAVRGKLVGSSEGRFAQVGEYRKLQNGYAFKSEWFAKSGVRLLRNANIGHGVIRWDDTVYLPENRVDEFARFHLSEGDIVLTLDRPFIVTGTKVARITNADLPSLLLQRVGRFVETQDGLSHDFLFLWINSPHFNDQIDPGRSNGVPHISSKQVEAAEIYLPPLAEQHRIVAKVDELMALCDRLEVSLANADTTRQRLLEALLHEALTPGEEQEAAA